MKTFSCHQFKIIVSDPVLDIFHQHKQLQGNSHERGGILLGQVVDQVLYVIRASTPNIFDRSGRNWFERDKKAAQVLVDFEYHNSNRRTIYLGEWHTHPENIPSPSGQDRKMIKEQFSLSKLNEPFILLIIQGIHGLYVAFYDGKNLTACDELTP